MAALSPSHLSLAPLGAGDLIDRAVRLYRRHLFVLIRIAAPPVIIVAAGWMMLSISVQQIFLTSVTRDLFLYIALLIIALFVMLIGYLLILVVMGGATRTLVAHLLRNDPVTASATYKAVKARFWGLLLASFIVLMWIFASLSVSTMGGQTAAGILVFVSMLLSTILPSWVAAIFAVIGATVAACLSLWLFFLMVGRIAYVHQVMLVEGKGVFDAVSRSFSLAKGNVRRLMAMTLFTTFATLSAMAILVFLIGFLGGLSGINLRNSAEWPAWYAIVYSILGPLSSILLTPVWMLGLSLLYVDERVRHEGYDIELMAAQKLGEVPDINVVSPLGTALHSMEKPPPPMPRPSGRIMDLS